MVQPVKLAVVGLGNRGNAYGDYTLRYPQNAQICAVCDKEEEKRRVYGDKHHVPAEWRFAEFDRMLDAISPDEVDSVVICTTDQMHYDMAAAALRRGFHVLCEKPMSPNPAQCVEMGDMAEKYGRLLMVCHVLRYNPFFVKLKELVDSNTIGDIITVQHSENVGSVHYTHSYVRGNTRNKEQSSPMILAKSCHDMDILLWLIGRDCRSVSSYGSLKYFTKENAPAGATPKCLDCPYVNSCPFSAKRIYLSDNIVWPVWMISVDTSLEARIKACREGRYGNCVFLNDNNVVDHQIVAMQFDGQITASFTMHGFSDTDARVIRISGTRGELRGHMEARTIEVVGLDGTTEVIHTPEIEGDHGGGDTMMLHDFVTQLRAHGGLDCRTSAAKSVQSHMMAFAAEQSRLLNGQPVDIAAFTAAQR